MKLAAKIIVAITAVTTMIGAVVAMFTVGVVGRVKEWCPTPCGSVQSCSSPFSGEEVCGELEQASMDHGWDGELPMLWIKYTASTLEDARGFKDQFGRRLAGVQKGAVGMEVAYLPVDRICSGATRHEAKHNFLGLEGKNKDAGHTAPNWPMFNGCK